MSCLRVQYIQLPIQTLSIVTLSRDNINNTACVPLVFIHCPSWGVVLCHLACSEMMMDFIVSWILSLFPHLFLSLLYTLHIIAS
jgi:hypothetical protein